MTDKEKLVELIRDGRACPIDRNPFDDETCMSCNYFLDVDCDITRLADHLLANGVRLERKQATSDKISDKIETNIYDSEEIHHNCTVQILRNSITREQSIGWWPEARPPREF